MILHGVLSLSEAAQRWGLTSAALNRAIKEGRLQATRSAGIWLIAYADMVATYGEPKGGEATQRAQ